MKTRALASVLLIVVLLGGCAENIEVRPGVNMSSDPADFPLPTSGYTVYIVGESHGNRETKAVFEAYLKELHEEANLRDVILEEDQAYESEANAYVRGETDELPTGLCLRADILGMIREFNLYLPDDEKITAHLVDVDSPFPILYKHLVELHSQIGPDGESVHLPDLSDVKYAKPEIPYGLIDELRAVSADRPEILNGLNTVQLSLEWYYLGNQLDVGWPIGAPKYFAPIREDIITNNVKFVLLGLDGKPVLAFFGANHGMKAQGFPDRYLPVEGFKPWSQRLVDENVAVHSIAIYGASGDSYWRGETLPNDENFLKEFQLTDGTVVLSLFGTYPDSSIIYTDLRAGSNSTIKLSTDLLDIPASQLYDGLIIFKEFIPMENVCPQ